MVKAGLNKNSKKKVVLRNKKVVLTITINDQTLEKLKSLVTQGNVSKTIEKLIGDWVENKLKAVEKDYLDDIQEKKDDEQVQNWYLLHRNQILKKKQQQPLLSISKTINGKLKKSRE